MNKQVTADSVAEVSGPYSHAIRAGMFVFVSAQSGQDPDSGMLSPDVSSQTEHAIENLKRILAATGKELGDVVRVGLYLTDSGDETAVNTVYASHFRTPFPPARTLLFVRTLPLGAMVEIDAIAI